MLDLFQLIPEINSIFFPTGKCNRFWPISFQVLWRRRPIQEWSKWGGWRRRRRRRWRRLPVLRETQDYYELHCQTKEGLSFSIYSEIRCVSFCLQIWRWAFGFDFRIYRWTVLNWFLTVYFLQNREEKRLEKENKRERKRIKRIAKETKLLKKMAKTQAKIKGLILCILIRATWHFSVSLYD